MTLVWKIGIAVAALTVGATGVAAAGLATASDHDGQEQHADKHGEKHAEKHADKGQKHADKHADKGQKHADKHADKHGEQHDDEGTGPVGNHGAEVSAVAKSDATTGRDHGKAVSEVARQGHGHGPSDEHPAERP